MKIDRDRLMNADPGEVARAATALADTVQDIPAHVRVLACATFVKLFFERMGIEPQDVMTAAGNIIAESERQGPHQFQALVEYLRADF